jgi:tetratricopeptide (TPR) repeat protein
MGLVTEVPPADRAVYIETMLPLYTANASPLTGMRRHRDKLVRGPTPQYYDLVADPGELRDLHAEAGDAVAELTRALEQVTAAFPGASETGTRTVTPEEAECLRSLGYLSAGASAGRNLPDVAALLRSQQLMDEAFAHLRAGRMAEALRSNAEARNLCGLFRDTVLQEVMILEQMGRREEAARAADDFLRQRPDAEVAIVQAQVYLRLGRYEEMERALAVAASVDPGNGSVHIVRGDRLCLEGRLEEALREYGEAIRVDGVRLGPVVEPQMARVRAAIQSRGR